MNFIARPTREADEIATIRAAVEREEWPTFVTDFDIELGEYLNEPAVWIIFKRVGDDGLEISELRERGRQINAFAASLQKTLFNDVTDRIAFFRSISVNGKGHSLLDIRS